MSSSPKRVELVGSSPHTAAVLLLASTDAVAITMMVGVLAAGRLVGVLDPAAPDARLSEQIAVFGARVLLASADQVDRARRLNVSDLRVVDVEREPASMETVLAPATDPDAPATLMFTSGSTGNPKALVIQHRPLRWSGVRGTDCVDSTGAVAAARALARGEGLKGRRDEALRIDRLHSAPIM